MPPWSAGGRLALLRCAVLGAIMLGAAQPAEARPLDEYLGRPVVAVRLESAGEELSDPTLLDLVVARPGTALSMAAVRESILHLFSLGRFRDVQVDASLTSDGVLLRFVLVPVRTVGTVLFRGRLGLPAGELRRLVTERAGPVPHIGRIPDAVRALEEAYRLRGYSRPQIGYRLVEEARADRATLIFEVDAGPRARLGAVIVEGTAPLSNREIRRRLGLEPGRWLDSGAIDQRLARVVQELRRRGYYEASGHHRVALRPDGRTADVTVVLDAGPHVTVTFEGDPLPPERIAELVPIAREGSADEDLLEDSGRRIVEYLRSQGYWRAEVTHTRTGDAGELTIVFRVHRGPQYRVAALEITGARALSRRELDTLLHLRPGALFLEGQFAADVAAVTERYRRLGYADVKIETTIIEAMPAPGSAVRSVTLRLAIDEGSRTLIGSVRFEGNRAVAHELLRALVVSTPGQPFYRPQLVADREAILQHYLNAGYPRASVEVSAGPAEGGMAVVFRIHEGPQIRVDHILVVGNQRTRTEVIRRELALRPGSPLGFEALVESQRRLSALGLFRRIRISELDHGAENRRDLLVAVEEAPVTTLGYGGGVEVSQRLRRAAATGGATERLEVAPRGFLELARRNLGGKNRALDLFTRISLRPRDEDPSRGGGGVGFSEYRVVTTYREPRPFGWRADSLVTAFVEQAIRSSFSLNRQGITAELRRPLMPRVSLSGRYTYNRNRLFNERFNPEDRPLVDRLFPQVKLSTFSVSLVRDTRDDPVDPARGSLLEVDGELAGRAVGSEVGFAKTYLQGFLYRRWPGRGRVVLAAAGRLGLARPFPRMLTDPAGPTEVREIPASERFFAGGDTTVRGFALDRLGDAPTIDKDGFPKGGNALLVVNAELRAPVWRALGVVAFLDAGNVFATASAFDLSRLRAGAGVGVRYRSPIGPIRVDLGFKLGRLELLGPTRERRRAIHIAIGHAF